MRIAAGVKILDQPFVAHGNVATAGGCLSSHCLAAWIIATIARYLPEPAGVAA